jgi:eukaryotic-like serine/threonine-protein kinase
MDTISVSREAILDQLERMLASPTFAGAERSRALLKFLVEQGLDRKTERLKEYTLGAEALGKGDDFDPRTDPIVRAEVSRLRARIDRYYAAEGATDPLLIALPKGSYVPVFSLRDAPAPAGRPAAAERPADASSSHSWKSPGVAAVLVALAAAVALWGLGRGTADTDTAAVQWFHAEMAPPGSALASDVGPDVVLSPDGSRVVFVVRDADGATRLMTRRLDQSVPMDLAGTEGARSPFMSPDGRWVGFWAGGALKKTSVDGGSPVLLCQAADLHGASWGDNGDIVAAFGAGTLLRIPESAGAPVEILDLTPEAIGPRWPQVLPGGKHILFTAVGSTGPNTAQVEVLSIADGRRTVVLQGGTYGRYHPDGYLMFINQGALFALAFDLDRMTTRGSAVAVLDDVAYSSTFGFAHLDVARNGTLVYRRAVHGALVVSMLDGTGRVEPLLTSPGDYTFPRISPDERRLALAVTESGAQRLLMYDMDASRSSRLPPDTATYGATWTPDSRFLVTGGPSGLRWIDAQKGEAFAPLTRSTSMQIPWSFTSDGTRLAYSEVGETTGLDLWTVPVEISDGGLSAGEPEPFLTTRAFEGYPSFSPDGRWLAYSGGEYGRHIYVRPFPDDGRPAVEVSKGGGRIPAWLPGGRELLYRSEDHRLMVVAFTIKDGVFLPGAPRLWSSAQLADTGVLANFDVHPDGMRVVALLPAPLAGAEQPRSHATFGLNFVAELRRRLSSPN